MKCLKKYNETKIKVFGCQFIPTYMTSLNNKRKNISQYQVWVSLFFESAKCEKLSTAKVYNSDVGIIYSWESSLKIQIKIFRKKFPKQMVGTY